MCNLRPRIIAVDFDGTLCEGKFPDIGAPILPVIEYVKRLRASGNIIILWTCRTGQNLADAVTWCKQQGLTFDYINENVKQNVEQYGGDTRKIFADVYIDDKTILPQQIIIKESIEMTNKEKQQITTDVASAVINDIDNTIAEHFCGDVYYTVRNALNDIADKYGVKRNNLADYTWEEIAEIAAQGKAAANFHIGDKKELELITGEKLTAVIIGFDHDVIETKGIYADNHKLFDVKKCAGITFAIEGVLDGWFEMNEDDTNKGGWKNSKMRTVYMSRIEKLLPAELRAVLRTVAKFTGKGGGSDDVETTADKLFLFSEAEIIGDDVEYSASGEGSQYPYFADAANRIKKRHGGGSYYWWLRSPNVAYADYFRCVYSDGSVGNGYASGSCGVSFGFCL